MESEETQAAAPAGFAKKAAACWGSNKSLWIGLAVLLLAVVGQILLNVLPSDEFFRSSVTGEYYDNRLDLINSLTILANSGLYVGAFWVGGYMAFWGFRKKS